MIETIIKRSTDEIFSLLICTLISENQGLEKLRSDSNLRKISRPAHLDFFQVYGINLTFFLDGDLEKKSRFTGADSCDSRLELANERK